MKFLEEVLLEGDELEALRLADALGLSHESAARKMKISRQTFGRIVKIAREKVAKGILQGNAIRIADIDLSKK